MKARDFRIRTQQQDLPLNGIIFRAYVHCTDKDCNWSWPAEDDSMGRMYVRAEEHILTDHDEGVNMKAIYITQRNRPMLMQRYNQIEEKFMPLGFWLVADFGDDNMDFSLLSTENLDKDFTRGPAIENGFIQITKKEAVG